MYPVPFNCPSTDLAIFSTFLPILSSGFPPIRDVKLVDAVGEAFSFTVSIVLTSDVSSVLLAFDDFLLDFLFFFPEFVP